MRIQILHIDFYFNANTNTAHLFVFQCAYKYAHLFYYPLFTTLLLFMTNTHTYMCIFIYLFIYIHSNGAEYFVSLSTSVALAEGYNVMVKSEELIGITQCLTLCTRCRYKQCRYNRIRLIKKNLICRSLPVTVQWILKSVNSKNVKLPNCH